ncbi:MAG: glutamate 5-kinase [Chloroflexota bacterium]
MKETAKKEQKENGLRYRRIVVKFGTSLLTGGSSHLDLDVMSRLVTQVALLHQKGAEVIVVSSGAIAAGRHKLGLNRNIRGIPYKQVLAAVGQGRLMSTYEQLFAPSKISVAQALLTKTDLSDRAGYLNARNTLMALMELRVIGIVNENDVVAVDEIQEAKFGDNDNLSAMVANLVNADLLMLLTNTRGLYTAEPSHHPDAKLIPEVAKIDASITRLAARTTSQLGTGGMITKIEAAKLATTSGITVVIADGNAEDVILRLAAGESIGTRFLPRQKIESRKRWMVSGLCTVGKVVIDPGAAQALRTHQRSLLSAGIRQAEGNFDRGDLVDIYDTEGTHLGCGITNYSAHDIAVIKGARSRQITELLGFDYGPEVVHRNNLTVI